MAWVHLVHGNSVVLEGKYCESDLQSQASSEGESAEKPKLSFLAPFVDKVKKMGFSVMLQNDSDGEYCTFFAGKELFPDRHIYPGSTKTCAIESLPDDFDILWGEIIEAFQAEGFKLYSQHDGVNEGVILSCFD
tara:strand:+ start:2371 stop:2772 length:402 start_codon:yes stop_codon:yes gene_type:complete